MMRPLISRTECGFDVKEYADGQPWILIELSDAGILGMIEPRANLHFDLKPGTTLEEAEALAEKMGNFITAIAYARWDKPEPQEEG